MAVSIFKIGSRILRVEEAVLQNFYHPLHLTIFNVLFKIRISHQNASSNNLALWQDEEKREDTTVKEVEKEEQRKHA